MGKLNIAPTKSNLLVLKKQLAFAEEGYDLLEQKRQILIFELMSRLGRARDAEQATADALRHAFEALLEAELDIGSAAIDKAVLAVDMDYHVDITNQHLMGMELPRVTVRSEPVGVQFGVGGTSATTDVAMSRFAEALPLLAELAPLSVADGTGKINLKRRFCKLEMIRSYSCFYVCSEA